jgi:hypothetical protein
MPARQLTGPHTSALPSPGAPGNDDNFFCDACFGVCFLMVPTPASYAKAAEDCMARGGYLPVYNESAKQVGRGLSVLQQREGRDVVAAGHVSKLPCFLLFG